MGEGQKPCFRRGKPPVAPVPRPSARRTPQPQQSIAVGRFGANRAADSGCPQPLRRRAGGGGHRHFGGRRRRKHSAVPPRCRRRRVGRPALRPAAAAVVVIRRFRRCRLRSARAVLRRFHRLHVRRAGADQRGAAAARRPVRRGNLRRRRYPVAADD